MKVTKEPQRRVLLCGHRAFACRGFAALLTAKGYDVWTFSRGPELSVDRGATGPVAALHESPHLSGTFDIVVNYIFLQGETVEPNLAYVESLLQFCAHHGVKHLVHISSCSVYKNTAKLIDENAPAETNPRKKGPYAAVKLAAEDLLTRRRPEGLKISMVRPGIILGSGMGGFMGGIALRLPGNGVLGLGSAKSQLPVVGRDQMNRALEHLVASPPDSSTEVVLLAAPNSPTRREYVQGCCEVLGAGTRSVWLPTAAWLTMAAVGEVVLPLVGRRGTGVYSKVRSVCRYQRYSVWATEKRIGESLSLDWRAALAGSFSGTDRNYHLRQEAPDRLGEPGSVSFLGFGRIVRQRHLPALRRMRFKGEVSAYDLAEREDPVGVKIMDIGKSKPRSAALHVVATPGPSHIDAVDVLQEAPGRILVEKPLCYSRKEFARWREFEGLRGGGVFCCHSSRFRTNVLRMMAHLRRYNAGQLIHAEVEFQSPPVAWDPALWLRAERRSATLLLDYGIHLLDIAAMFGVGTPSLRHCRYDLNGRGETSLIDGFASFDNYTVGFVLRQGLFPRKGIVRFTFQNYSVYLGFSPDTFVAVMADESFGRSLQEAGRQALETGRKALALIRGQDIDRAHDRVLAAVMADTEASGIRVTDLEPVYDLLFDVKEAVYGSA